MLRDFKKFAAMTIEQTLERLAEIISAVEHDGGIPSESPDILTQLEKYYEHMQKLACGYERNPQKLAENLAVIQAWRNEITILLRFLGV
jgi:hypothetical protein